ncbi:hypothetical protein TPA0907_17860 [Micromonospora humidisoli]|nr:hypothetical protein TPA0907_17860 [Micromonospora sp. AKA109]
MEPATAGGAAAVTAATVTAAPTAILPILVGIRMFTSSDRGVDVAGGAGAWAGPPAAGGGGGGRQKQEVQSEPLCSVGTQQVRLSRLAPSG